MSNKLQFDTERFCNHNMGRLGEWQGQDIAGLIAEEVASLRARLAEAEAGRDAALAALVGEG